MGQSTFTGPIRSGTVRQGASKNVGLAVLSQTAAVSVSGVAKTSGATEQALGIIIPAGSKILDFIVEVTTAISGNSVSQVGVQIGKAGTADFYAASFNTGVSAARVTHAVVDAGMASKVANLDNVGTADMPLYATFTATTGNPDAGVIKITAIYVQRNSDGTVTHAD